DTWAAVRRAYADASVPLAEIAKRYGLTPLRIGARAKQEGWAGREERQRRSSGSAKRSASKKADVSAAPATRRPKDALPTRGAQRALIGRLYRAISLKLEHMEERRSEEH